MEANKSKEKPAGKRDEPTREQEENEKRLPGDYPPNEDIMNPKTHMERVSLDVDNLNNRQDLSAARRIERNDLINDQPEGETEPASESDLTSEDYEALGPRDLSMDLGEDEQLKHRPWPVDFAAKDLDVPKEDADRLDALDQGDEENDHYSLGGDSHENLEDPTLG
jgi:hypothetical protein